MVKFSNPFKRAPAAAPATVPRPYRILFTRGEELIDPPTYRGTFEQALARALPMTGALSDDVVGRAYAVSMTAYACTEYRAATSGSIPLEVLNGVKGADETPLENTPLDYFLTTAPRLLAEWTRSHLIFGRTYIRKRYNARGFPTGLEWLNPLDVYEYTARNVVTGYRWTTPGGASERLELNEVIYAQAFDARPNGNGLSKFEAAWLALNIEASLATFAAAFFVNGAQPDGFLTLPPDMSDDQIRETRTEWQKNFRSAKNAHKTAVMPEGTSWQPITTSPKDLAMSDLKGSEREDVCAVFEVDPTLVHLKDTGDPLSANSTYSAIEISHIRNVALPFVRGVVLVALNEQWAMRDFGAPYRLDVDEAKIPALVEAQLAYADTAIRLSDSGILDYTESRERIGYAPRESYLVRKPDDALALWQAGAVTLNDVHSMVSGRAPLGDNGDVLLIGGALIPSARLMEVANANVEKLKAPPASPFGLSAPPDNDIGVSTPPAPQLPPGTTGAQPRADDHSLCAMLFFQTNDPALLSLQQRVRKLYADRTVEWTPPDAFHVTIFYAPDVSDVQAAQFSSLLTALPIPDNLSLTVGSLHSFDNVGEHALHFRIRRNADLLAYQERVFEAAQGVDILAGAHSAPDSYKPHITMGYCDTPAKAVTYSGALSVRPAALRLMYGDTLAYERPLLVQAQRSQPMPLQLAVDLSGNTFVRYARRILSDALTAQGQNADWVGESAWRVTLAACDEWNPAALSRLLKSADYSDVNKIDARITGFAQVQNRLYATVDAQAAALVKSADLDLSVVGLTPSRAAGQLGILLATTDAQVTAFPPVDFPIVLNAVGCYLGDECYHAWALRAASLDQVKELTNWQRVVMRKGREHDFHVETLPDGLRDYIGARLATNDAIETVFHDAKDMLLRADIPEPFVTPGQYTAYWGQFDALMKEVGADWLRDYSDRVWARIKALAAEGQPGTGVTSEAVDAILNDFADDLVSNWVGTSAAPGALTRLVLAGMAAGDQALQSGRNPAPTRAIIVVDWALLSQEALDYARQYAYDLIRNINATTTALIRDAVSAWVQQGAPQTQLAASLESIIKDPNRAKLIAQTESTRVYNEGAKKRWSAAGIRKVRWQTVNDVHVCPICSGLHNREGALDEGVYSPREQAFLAPPAHPGCRCFTKPVIDPPTQEAIDTETTALLAQMDKSQ